MVTAPDIPGHRVGGVLGAGGYATVYRCWQLAVGREVAVKVDNRVLLTERDRRRFLREVMAAGRLRSARARAFTDALLTRSGTSRMRRSSAARSRPLPS